MKSKYFGYTLLPILTLTGTLSSAQITGSISLIDVATANCPTEIAAWITIEPTLWEDLDEIGIDASLDQATTDAFNKYSVAVLASNAHISSIIRLSDPAFQTQSYFNKAKLQYNLSTCMIPTSPERNLIIKYSLLARPTLTAEKTRDAFFKVFDEIECTGLAQVSVEVFHLDPQSDSFSADYLEAMSNLTYDCS